MKRNHMLRVRLSDEELKRLEEIANSRQWTLSQAVRWLVDKEAIHQPTKQSKSNSKRR